MQEDCIQKTYNPIDRNPSEGTKGLLSLIFGILSYFVCPLIFGIVAIILGASELSDIREMRSAPENKAIATAGMWLGIINVALIILSIVLIFILILFFSFTIPFLISN